MKTYELIIDGKRTKSDNYFDVVNPATLGVVGQCATATATDLDAAVDAARRAFPAWSQTPEDERKSLMHSIADIIKNNGDELASLITQEQGKPLAGLAGIGSHFEISGAEAWCRATAELSLPIEIADETDEQRVELHRKPLGVVASITPWNFPLMIAIWHIIPALKTGNTVVLKPSSLTPLATLRFAELVNEILPPGVLNVVTGEGGLGRKMTGHTGIDKVVFTGSTPTGKNIMANAAVNLKRLTLELGGNDAAIILPDVDPSKVAMRIFISAFLNSGQTCGALKRLYVHDDIYDAMCEALTNIAQGIKVGNGADEDTDLGPVQNKDQFDFVCELAEDARQNGARFLTGGNPTAEDGYFYPVTLVADITDGSRLVDEEPFGPILPIIRYTDVEDALRRANDNPNGLGGSVWSNDIDKAKALAMRLECGSAWINNHAAIQPNVPFGGVKESGFGVEFSTHGMEEYTSLQAVYIPK